MWFLSVTVNVKRNTVFCKVRVCFANPTCRLVTGAESQKTFAICARFSSLIFIIVCYVFGPSEIRIMDKENRKVFTKLFFSRFPAVLFRQSRDSSEVTPFSMQRAFDLVTRFPSPLLIIRQPIVSS
jgi:hypothetical protein